MRAKWFSNMAANVAVKLNMQIAELQCFLLAINCHLSAILHHFRDIAKSETIPPQFEPWSRGSPSTFAIKLGRQRIKALGYILLNWKLQPVCASQYTRVTDRRRRQTITSYCNSGNLQRSAKTVIIHLLVAFFIFLLIFERDLQQCSANEPPVMMWS